jgi:hypothetical protein
VEADNGTKIQVDALFDLGCHSYQVVNVEDKQVHAI